VQRLSAENDRLKAEAENRATENSALIKEKQAAEVAAKSAEKNVTDAVGLTQERDDLKQKLAALTAKQSEADAQLAASRQASEAAQKELGEARGEVEALKAERGDAQKQSARVSELESALQKVSAERDGLQARLAGLDALQAENARLSEMGKNLAAAQRRIAELEGAAAQLSNVRRDFTVLTADSMRLKATLQTVEQDRRTQVARLQQENLALSARLRQVQGTLDQIAAAARFVTSGGANPSQPQASPPSVMPISAASGVPANPGISSGRVYTVVEGDSLTKISVRYYGTGNRWQEIYLANRDVLRGQNALRIGQQIIVP
jgi:nucleoid-associated protein YgaU